MGSDSRSQRLGGLLGADGAKGNLRRVLGGDSTCLSTMTLVATCCLQKSLAQADRHLSHTSVLAYWSLLERSKQRKAAGFV